MIPKRKKTGRDVRILLKGAFIPRIKRKIAAKAKRDPLKGLPEVQARAETENKGRHRKVDKNLFDGFHLKIRAAKSM